MSALQEKHSYPAEAAYASGEVNEYSHSENHLCLLEQAWPFGVYSMPTIALVPQFGPETSGLSITWELVSAKSQVPA